MGLQDGADDARRSFSGSQRGLNGHARGGRPYTKARGGWHYDGRSMGASASPLPAALDVVPGEQASCEIRIRNDGQVVDEFTFEVLGDAAPWAQVVPASLQLLPATLGAVKLQVSPPRRPSTKDGAVALGLKIVSKEDPEHPRRSRGS